MLILLLAIMVLAWSGNFVMAKVGLQEIPPLAMVTLRLWIATLLMGVIYYSREERRRFRPRREDLLPLIGLGFLGVTMNQAGFVVGMNNTTVGHSSLIIGLGPIMVLILALLLKLEKLNVWRWIGMGLAFSGAVVLASEHGLSTDSPTLLGDVIIFVAAFSFSLYTVFGKRVADRYDTVTLNTFTYLAGALLTTPLTGWQLFEIQWSAVGWRGWAGAFYMGVMGSVVAYMIFYYALTKIEATRLAALSYLQPVIATCLAFLFLQESVSVYLVLGGSFILLGVYLAERGSHRLARVPPAD